MSNSRQAAAQAVVSLQLGYAERGIAVATAAMAGAASMTAWRHFPHNDVVDRANGTRYFYHAHDSHRTAGEHGHFHLFAADPLDEPGRGFVQVAALSIDARGMPLRWFFTNAWVTGETWREAAVLEPVIRGFAVETRGRLAPVARWLTAMVRLFEAELVSLANERDAAFARHGLRGDDRSIDELAGISISLEHHLRALAMQQPDRRRARPAAQTLHAIPSP